jgi:hypothetical protein
VVGAAEEFIVEMPIKKKKSRRRRVIRLQFFGKEVEEDARC